MGCRSKTLTVRLVSLRDTARAMSQENMEIVRASLDAWNERDMDVLRERYAEDVVTWPPTGWPEEGPFVDRDTVMAQWERKSRSENRLTAS